MVTLSVKSVREALEGGVGRVLARAEELNRINVFPVADGDTGTNLAQTLGGAILRLKERESLRPFQNIRELMEAWAETLVREARGNSGVLLAQYFDSLARALPESPVLDVSALARAMDRAARDLYRVVSTPVEGTLLTVAREIAEEARKAQTRDIRSLFERLVERARKTLQKTPDLLPVLREHGVVDAGALGFTLFVEGMKEALWGKRVALEHLLARIRREGLARGGKEGEALTYRFCTETLVRPEGTAPSRDAVVGALQDLGDSLLVVATPRWIHVHIHTNTPEEVFARMEQFGVLVETKADDMEAQRKQDLPAFLMDTTLDLPPDVAFKLGVIRIPVQVILEDRVYDDGMTVHPEDVLQVQRAGKTLKTSQPSPHAFQEAYAKALERASWGLSFHLSGKLSGTVRAAEQVVRARGLEDRIRVVDTHLISSAGGFLLWQACDLLSEGRDLEEVLAILEERARRSLIVLSVHDLTYIIRSGRLSGGASWVARALRMKVVLEFSGKEEVLRPVARLLPFQSARKRMIREAIARMDPDVPYDVAVVHTGELGRFVDEVMAAVAAERKVRRQATGHASSAITAHIGPWGMGILAVPTE